MATLVFDIETSALPVELFDEAQQEYLFRETEKIDDAIAKEAKRGEIARFMSLWPFTSQVVCIAMLNAETGRGQVQFLAEDFEEDAGEAGPVEFVPCADESELLTAFWDVARHYDNIVTFNGRGFDVPFIYLRSALLNIPITKKNWLGYRYATEPHCDLAEQLTFYSVSGRDGAAGTNLDFYCKAFGIESPKSHGVTGMDVKDLMAAGQFREIAEYCLRDVRATVSLYKIWKERLAGNKMSQSIRYPKSQVRIGSEDSDADRLVVEKILLSAHDKFNLYDNSHTSQVSQTIRSLVEGKGFGFGLGARIVGNDILVDFIRGRSQSPKFDEVHDFILTELKNTFKMEFEEIWDDQPNYCNTH